MSTQVRRKLTTILAADAEGYSRIMQQDEVRGVSALRRARAVFSKFIERHAGRIANTAGDGLIAEFPSVVEAVQCAIEVQQELSADAKAPGGALCFRIGVHLGDVIVDGDDLLGEGVNLAARLQSMAEPGGILISRQVYDQVHAKLSVGFDYLGEKRPKNFIEDVSVFRVSTGGDIDAVRPQVSAGSSSAVKDDAAREPAIPPSAAPLAQVDQAERTTGYYAKRLALVCGALFGIDVFTGGGLWSHFPIIALVGLFGITAAPANGWGQMGEWASRATVLVVALTLINLATWGGYLWVAWPAGALFVLGLAKRMTDPKT